MTNSQHIVIVEEELRMKDETTSIIDTLIALLYVVCMAGLGTFITMIASAISDFADNCYTGATDLGKFLSHILSEIHFECST